MTKLRHFTEKQVAMRAFLRSVVQNFVYILFPTLCTGCFRMLYGEEKEVCTTCRMRLPYLTTEEEQAALGQKFAGRVAVDYVYAYTYFSKKGVVQRLVHDLKYRGNASIGYHLGLWFGQELARQDATYLHADWLLPVPIHPARRRERGYNQSEEICRGLTQALGIRTRTDLLWRTKFYASQTRKSRAERLKNVSTAFKVIKPEQVRGQHVVLVDDVLTTGATLEACATELRQAGAATVGILVLAAAR
jgi:ComF family protein